MAEPRSLRVEAVVLRHLEVGEADRILTIYSREQGKLRCIAKGVRKIRSRKAGHIQPFSRVKLMLARGHDLWIITQAELIDAYPALQENLVILSYAAYVIELLDRFSYEEGPNQALYRLLERTLDRLTKAEHPEMVVRYYDMRLLDLMGFRPQLFNCVNCEKEIIAQDQYFSAQRGGVLCPNCGHASPVARPIPMQVLKYMRHFQKASYSAAMKAPYHEKIYKQFASIVNYYYLYLLERRLNSPGFLRKIKKADESSIGPAE
ncbi:MAG: DNA repair protein RecO [Anaerolineae bacterium]|jgi:DNA repair protein RecO (recombination protein O)|nr:DNA repair protein RecO [Anaerolineae bacterium]